jgi:hypothetical protein
MKKKEIMCGYFSFFLIFYFLKKRKEKKKMKLVIRTFIFHIFCIFIFAFIYANLSQDFPQENDRKSFIDFLLLSTTIQAGVGIYNVYPLSYYSKIAMISQQILMLLTYVITLYIFTL